jgi:hypothetical protein
MFRVAGISPSTGLFEPARTFKWPRAAHDPVIKKITRGLYYHHYGTSLLASAEIEVTFLDKLHDPIKDGAMGEELTRYNLGGDDRFCYACGRVKEMPEFSMWIYQFYLRHWAAAVTKPEGHIFA